MLNIKNSILTIIVFFTAAVVFTGCIKKDPESKIAQVLLAPLSPNAQSVDFSINGQLYAVGIAYSTTAGTIRYTLPYYTIEPKAGSVVAYNFTGFTTALASVNKDMADGQVYSTFLIDSTSKAKAVVVNDDLTDPNPGKVKIRFFHFSPNTVPLDVMIQGTTTKLFSNRSFNDQITTTANEKFIEIDPGNYTFLFNNVTTGATVYTTSLQTFLPDRIYTMAVRGFTGGTGTVAIGAWVYANKP